MGNYNYSSKSSYYKLMKKEKKKLYEIKSELNGQIITKWIKKNTKIIKRKNLYSDWKIFLLKQLHNSEGWKHSLYNFIHKEINNKQTYLLENEIFIEQFCFIFFPKNFENNKNKKYPKKDIKILENSVENILDDDKSEKLIRLNENLSSKIERLDTNSLKSAAEINNIQLEKEYINIIRKHLELDINPINDIINKFSEEYSNRMNNKINLITEEKYENDLINIKIQVIEDIQTFIELIKVSLKFFYFRVISYKYFLDEKDEVFNLVSSILFKNKKFYQSLFKLFQLSNEQKINDLEQKKIKIGKLSPKDAGISPKFCLDDETEKLKKDKDYLKNEKLNENKNKSKLAHFLEKTNSENSDRSSIIHIDEEERIRNTFDFTKKKDDRDYSFYNIKRQYSYSFKNYKDISNKLESVKSELDNLQLENSFLFSFNNNNKYSKIPYGKVINYINSIQDNYIPHNKLIIMALSNSLIHECIDEYWKNVENIEKKYLDLNVDELITIYLYIIYNLNLDTIYTELDFIKYFTRDIDKNSILGFYYSTFEGCLNFIMSINKKEDFLGDNN